MRLNKMVIAASVAALFAATPALAQIKVGVSLSATGPAAALGIPEKNAFALMPTEVAGQKIEYIMLDDATDPSLGTKNARKLVSEDRVDVLIGSSATPASAAIAEVANESGTPQLALAPVTLPADKEKWVFRLPQHNKVMASALVGHMKTTGVKSLGFIGYSDAYGEDWITAIKPMLESAGIKFGPIERFNRTDTSVSGQVLKLVSSRPDAVLVVGSGSPAALPQTSLVERGYKGRIYQTHAAANPAFLRVAGKAAEGAIIPIGPVVVADQVPDSHPSKQAGLSFVKAYEAKYGEGSFSSFAGHANDAFLLLQDAIPVALKSAKPGTPEFRKALRDALESGKEVVASHGVYKMTADDHFGADDRARVLIRVENGGYKLLGK
jgi:branched-chain amino acid transport system substrate-binding protein